MSEFITVGTTPVQYSLNLACSANAVVEHGARQGYRIRIMATPLLGFHDADVFRYQKLNTTEALFTGVCSPADLADYTQNPSELGGFFRRNIIDLVFASEELAMRIRDEIVAHLETLCSEMARIDNTMTAPHNIVVTSA